MQFGLNFQEFFDTYFNDHDEAFLSNLGEIISEKDDSREIAALADWSFRNYVIDAVTIALQLNNEKIYNDIMALLEERKPAGTRDRELPPPPRTSPVFREESFAPPVEKADMRKHFEDRPFPGGFSHGAGEERPGPSIPGKTSTPRAEDYPPVDPRVFQEKPILRGYTSGPAPGPAQGGDVMKGMPELRELRDMKKMAHFTEKSPDEENEEPGREEPPPPPDYNYKA